MKNGLMSGHIKVLISVFCMIGAISPFVVFSGVRGVYIHLILLLIVIFYSHEKVEIKYWFGLLVFCLIGFSAISALYWVEPELALMPVYILTGYVVVKYCDRIDVEKAVDYSTYLLVLMIIGAWMAYIYAYFGGNALFLVFGGYEKGLFFYPFSLVKIFGAFKQVIRPSGIYDEPGAFSFVICFVSTMRIILGKKKGLTLILLLFGFVTMSLAHLMYFLVFVVATILDDRKMFYWVLVTMLVWTSFNEISYFDNLEKSLFSRIEYVEGEGLSGDNRSFRMYNAIEYMSKDIGVFLFGLDSELSLNYVNAKYNYKPIGENILSPLVVNGLFVSISFYLILILLAYRGLLNKKYFVVIGMVLLFAQRPYAIQYGYAFMVAYLLVYTEKIK